MYIIHIEMKGKIWEHKMLQFHYEWMNLNERKICLHLQANSYRNTSMSNVWKWSQSESSNNWQVFLASMSEYILIVHLTSPSDQYIDHWNYRYFEQCKIGIEKRIYSLSPIHLTTVTSELLISTFEAGNSYLNNLISVVINIINDGRNKVSHIYHQIFIKFKTRNQKHSKFWFCDHFTELWLCATSSQYISQVNRMVCMNSELD